MCSGSVASIRGASAGDGISPLQPMQPVLRVSAMRHQPASSVSPTPQQTQAQLQAQLLRRSGRGLGVGAAAAGGVGRPHSASEVTPASIPGVVGGGRSSSGVSRPLGSHRRPMSAPQAVLPASGATPVGGAAARGLRSVLGGVGGERQRPRSPFISSVYQRDKVAASEAAPASAPATSASPSTLSRGRGGRATGFPRSLSAGALSATPSTPTLVGSVSTSGAPAAAGNRLGVSRQGGGGNPAPGSASAHASEAELLLRMFENLSMDIPHVTTAGAAVAAGKALTPRGVRATGRALSAEPSSPAAVGVKSGGLPTISPSVIGGAAGAGGATRLPSVVGGSAVSGGGGMGGVVGGGASKVRTHLVPAHTPPGHSSGGCNITAGTTAGGVESEAEVWAVRTGPGWREGTGLGAAGLTSSPTPASSSPAHATAAGAAAVGAAAVLNNGGAGSHSSAHHLTRSPSPPVTAAPVAGGSAPVSLAARRAHSSFLEHGGNLGGVLASVQPAATLAVTAAPASTQRPSTPALHVSALAAAAAASGERAALAHTTTSQAQASSQATGIGTSSGALASASGTSDGACGLGAGAAPPAKACKAASPPGQEAPPAVTAVMPGGVAVGSGAAAAATARARCGMTHLTLDMSKIKNPYDSIPVTVSASSHGGHSGAEGHSDTHGKARSPMARATCMPHTAAAASPSGAAGHATARDSGGGTIRSTPRAEEAPAPSEGVHAILEGVPGALVALPHLSTSVMHEVLAVTADLASDWGLTGAFIDRLASLRSSR